MPDLATATLPVPAAFDASAPTPHPRGLIGLNRSARPGSGSEFNTIRQFHPGDRLRRIHWPVSLRTGELHVTSTYADEDAHVVLLVDAFSDLGPREGIDGRPTSLDLTVRAAGAISEHFLSSGDRLTLRTVGAAHVPVSAPAQEPGICGESWRPWPRSRPRANAETTASGPFGESTPTRCVSC